MSSGSILKDNTYILSGTCRAGTYYSKTWAGGDSPLDHSKENSYSMEVIAYDNPPITYYTSADGWLTPYDTLSYRCAFGGFAFPTALLDSNEDYSLVGNLKSKIVDHKFHAGIFLGEGREAAHLVSSSALQLYNGIKALKRGDLQGVGKALGVKYPRGSRLLPPQGSKSLGSLSNNWLAFQFGWLPLVNDLHDGSQAIFSLLNRPVTRVFKSSIFRSSPGNHYNGTVAPESKMFHLRELRVKLKEDYSPLAGLGLTHPSEVLWEVTPWSFVCDWAVPIGNFLAARNFLNDLSTESIFLTDFKTQEGKTSYADPRYFRIENSGSYRYKHVKLVRSSYSVTNLPSPKFKKLDSWASFRRMLTSLALLIQAGPKLNR